MPIYEFQCPECNIEFEELVYTSSFNEVDIHCPKCGNANPQKKLSLFTSPGLSAGNNSCAGCTPSPKCSSCGVK